MLEVNQQLVDLGTLKFGQTYSFNYTIVNKYPTKIKINKVFAGCSACTKVSIDRDEIMPDEEIDIKVSFTPGSTGVQKKYVNLAYSDFDNTVYPDLQLKFTGNVNG